MQEPVGFSFLGEQGIISPCPELPDLTTMGEFKLDGDTGDIHRPLLLRLCTIWGGGHVATCGELIWMI